LPYAQVLATRGHEVLITAPAEVAEPLRNTELRFAPFDHPGDETLGPIWARFASATQDESMTIAVRDLFVGANARFALSKLLDTIKSFRPDLIVRDSIEYGSLIAAETLDVRHVRVAVHSVSFEEEIPALATGPLDALRRSVGLSPDEAASLTKEAVFSSFPAALDVVPASSAMQPPFRSRAIEDPPSTLPATWAPEGDPRPLIYVTFGSIVGNIDHIKGIYQTALDALRDLPVRALLTTGKTFDVASLGPIPANVHVEPWVPQRDVLGRVKGLVCHGGSGTLLGGLSAGLPMVVVPFGADQPHNGKLVSRAGAGINLDKPDATALGAAIMKMLETPALRVEAQKLAKEIARMPKIEDAVRVMEQMVLAPNSAYFAGSGISLNSSAEMRRRASKRAPRRATLTQNQ